MRYVGKHFEDKSKFKSKQKGKHFENASVLKSTLGYVNFSLIVLVCIVLTLVPSINNILAFFTYVDAITNVFTIVAEYTIEYDANGGTGLMADQIISFNVPTRLLQNTYTNSGYTFAGWNTAPDGSGTPYADEEQVTNLIGQNNQNVVLYAQWAPAGGVAMIGTTIYQTLQAAIDDVPTDGTKTVITLLANVSECLSVSAGKNIRFNLQNFEVTNDSIINTNDATIENYGTIEITNGTLTMNRKNASTINNYMNATCLISGGTIQMTVTGGKQAIYNWGGTLEISGNPYISSVSPATGGNSRATVDNTNKAYDNAHGVPQGTVPNGVLIITGGTIVSQNTNAVSNNCNMRIGTKDGNASTTSPIIQGGASGITSTSSFDYYDGTIKGKTSAINNETNVNDIETDCRIFHSQEIINNDIYKTAFLSTGKIVEFDSCGGIVDETQRSVEPGNAVGTLPIPTKGADIFDGWFTESTGGTQITSTTLINNDIIFYAHWTTRKLAEVNGVGYDTLKEAIENVPKNNVETTITLNGNTSEKLTVVANQNIVFDLQNNTISNSGTNPVIANNGTIKIINGTITSNTTQGAINNNSGATLIMTGGSIIATGTRQAIYNNGGTVNISGTAYLSAVSTDRAVVQNLASGTMTITGGTIVSTGLYGVENAAGTLVIGTKDGTIDTTTPDIRGKEYGVKNSSTFKFYDGIIKGETDSINGNVAEIETNTTRVDTTQSIDGVTYHVTYLSP